MRFPTEQVLVASIFLILLISMVTCTPREKQKCDIIHEAVPFKKCEAW